jgi:hypothetical protein
MAILPVGSQFSGKFRISGVLNGNILHATDVKMSSTAPYSNGSPLRLRVAYGVSFSIIDVYDLTYDAVDGWSGDTGAYGDGTYRITLQGASDTDEYLVGYFPFQDLINMCRSGNTNTAYDKHIEMDNVADTIKVYWSHHTGDDEVVNPLFSIDGKSNWDEGDSDEYPFPLSKTYDWADVYDAASLFFRIGNSIRTIEPSDNSNGTITSVYLGATRNVAQRFIFYKTPQSYIPFEFIAYKVGSPSFTLRVTIYTDNGSDEPDVAQGYYDVPMWKISSVAGSEVEIDIPITGAINLGEKMYLRLEPRNVVTNDASNHLVYEYNDGDDEYEDGGMVTDTGIGFTQHPTDNLICEIANVYQDPVTTCEYGALVLGEPSDEDCVPDIDTNLLYKNCTRFILTDTITPIEIREPVGWDSVEIIYERHEKYLGVLTSYTSGDQELSFGNIGISTYECSKKYLDDQFDLEGIDAYVEFKFQILVDGTWYNLFKGICDFYERERGLDFTKMAVRRVSFNDQLKNLISTEVDVLSDEDIYENPLGAVKQHDVVLHSRHVRKSFYAEEDPVSNNNGTYTQPASGVGIFNYLPNNIILDSVQKRFTYPTGYIQTAQKELIELEMTGPMQIELHIEVIVNKANTSDVGLLCWVDDYESDEWGGLDYIDLFMGYDHTITSLGGGLYKHTFDINDGSDPGLYVDNYWPLCRAQKGRYFYLALKTSDPSVAEITIDETCTGFVRIRQDTMDYNTVNKLAYADDLMNAVLARISTATVQTNYLSQITEKGKIMLCGGLELKEIRDNWFVSFEKIIDSLQMLFDVGMGIKMICPGGYEEIFVEDRQHFFQNAQILQIDECEEYAEISARELVWNEIRLGYSQYQRDSEDDDNALVGYCSEQTRVTPIKYHKQSLDIICDFITDHYMIEDFRRQRHDAKEDKRSQPQDRDVFAINVDNYTTKTFNYRAGYFARYDPTYDTRIIIFGEILNYVDVGNSIQIIGTSTIAFIITTVEFDYERNLTFLGGHSGTKFGFGDFVINFIVSKKLAVRDEEFTLSEDIIQSSSIYNARYTPLEMLYNNQYRLVVSLSHKPTSEGYTFTSGVQNFDSYINPTSRNIKKALDDFVSVDEIEAINNSSAIQAQPVWVEFITEIGFAEVLIIEKAFRSIGTGYDYGYISVKNPDTGVYVDGWLYQMAFLPGTNRAKFKLLRAESGYLEFNNIVQEDNTSKIITEDTVDIIIQE